MTVTYQPSENYPQALDRAARLWGIEPEYGDTWGRVHPTEPETAKGILRALGVPTETRESLDAAVLARLSEEWTRLAPSVAVIGVAELQHGIAVSLPAELAGGLLTAEFRWEDGGSERAEADPGRLAEAGRMHLPGGSYVRRRLPVPAGAPLGYHEAKITLTAPGRPAETARVSLVVCPNRCYQAPALEGQGRAAGLAIALYGLRSARNWGCGDITDLEPLADWLAEDARASFIGLNPLHAIPNRQPFNISPYLPTSTLYKNPIYLDLERVPDFQRSRRARRWLQRESVQREIAELRGLPLVAYERVWALKLHGLKLAFAQFLHDGDGQSRAGFDAYVAREGQLLERYAVWCALDEWLHRRDPSVWTWPDWPEPYRDPESPEVRAFAAKHWRLVAFYRWLQWQVDLQLAAAQDYCRRKGLSIGLYHDLALATDSYGSDLWAWRPFYAAGCRVGAPPDGFSPKGQDWAFPPPNSAHHRETGYRMFAESIRHNARHGGALRMDHVMRFFRLYWIPEGLDPASGAYVRDCYQELLLILALESVRNQVVMIGEDLGTVTTEIRQALDRFGIYGYRVPYFEKWESGELKMPKDYAERAVVTSSTHDLPTLAGFWTGKDIECRRQAGLLPGETSYRQLLVERHREKQKFLDALFRLGLLPQWFGRRVEHVPELTGELHNALVGWIAQAPSRLLALNQEDLFKDPEQQNLPATTAEQYPNWMHKMRVSVEDLRRDPFAKGVTAMFRAWLERTGRVNVPSR